MYRMLVQSVTDYAIYMLDPDGHVMNWNVGAQRSKGYRTDEIIGQHFSCFFTPEDIAQHLPQRTLAEALARQKFEEEGWRLRRDGSRFWAHVVIQPICDDGGLLVGFAHITQDRSAQKQQRDQLRDLAKNLELALANMSQGLSLFDAKGNSIRRLTSWVEVVRSTTSKSPAIRRAAAFRRGAVSSGRSHP